MEKESQFNGGLLGLIGINLLQILLIGITHHVGRLHHVSSHRKVEALSGNDFGNGNHLDARVIPFQQRMLVFAGRANFFAHRLRGLVHREQDTELSLLAQAIAVQRCKRGSIGSS